MGLAILGGVLVAQAVVITIIIVILKKVLDSQLIILAARQLDLVGPQKQEAKLRRVGVVSHKPLHPQRRELFQQIVRKHLGSQAEIVFEINGRLWGGVILKLENEVLDFSLRDRLHQAMRPS